MRIIILAGGGTRKGWTPEHPKVMAEVEGKPIVLQVVLWVKERGHAPIVQTSFPQVIEAVGKECACYWPAPWSHHYHEMPVGGVYDSFPIWNPAGRTVLLCGDNVYPSDVLDKILEDESPIGVWGTVDEICGITFLPSEADELAAAVRTVLRHECIGHLWTVYRALCGFPLDAHQFEDIIFKKLERDVNLIDFDSVEKYEKWLE